MPHLDHDFGWWEIFGLFCIDIFHRNPSNVECHLISVFLSFLALYNNNRFLRTLWLCDSVSNNNNQKMWDENRLSIAKEKKYGAFCIWVRVFPWMKNTTIIVFDVSKRLRCLFWYWFYHLHYFHVATINLSLAKNFVYHRIPDDIVHTAHELLWDLLIELIKIVKVMK